MRKLDGKMLEVDCRIPECCTDDRFPAARSIDGSCHAVQQDGIRNLPLDVRSRRGDWDLSSGIDRQI